MTSVIHRSRAVVLSGTAAAVMLGLVGAPASAHAEVGHSDARIAGDWQRTAQRTVFTEHRHPYQPVRSISGSPPWRSATPYASQAAGPAHPRRPRLQLQPHDVLIAYFPASAANLDADLAASLAKIPNGRAERKGIEIGRRAAAAMVASRVDDGRNANIVYTRAPAPGVWQPPPTGMAVSWLGFVKPLVQRTPITVDGPDPIDSAAYAADFDEVKRLGSANSTERTAAQTRDCPLLQREPRAADAGGPARSPRQPSAVVGAHRPAVRRVAMRPRPTP